MRVTYEVGSYNPRRYGKPWIAKVVKWGIGKAPELEFGASVSPHVAEIDAAPGQIVRYGQKDHRGSGTVNRWGIVEADGDWHRTNPEDARDHWLAGCPAPKAEEAPDTTNVVTLPIAQEG